MSRGDASAASRVAPRSRLRLVLTVAGATVAGIAWLVIALWIVGRVLTDQYLWSQWLWWMPTPVLLPVCIMGSLAAARPAIRRGIKRRRMISWLLTLASLGVYFSVIEHRVFASPRESKTGVVVAHWNLSYPGPTELDSFASAAAAIDADVLILSSSAGVGRPDHPIIRSDDPRRVFDFGLFTVVTGLPIIGARPLVNRDGIRSYMIELDTSESLGRTAVIYMIDLPSERTTHRMELAQDFRDLLERAGAPLPDIVVGDFNIPRGSRSLEVMFPGLHHAWDDGGRGYSGTFHREYPYTHIDHVLLGSAWRGQLYQVFDPGVGRHRAQRARIVPAE